MSGASRGAAYKHFQRALARWPKDPLRPDCQLQDVLAKRLESRFAASPSASPSSSPAAVLDEDCQLRQANALYSLLDDRYKTKYAPRGPLYEPRSNPTYYADLVRELEAAPNRTWLQRLAKRLGGMIRMS